jgi:two-component system, OmpR family, catabolic regulation response regulator CreB
MFQAPREARRAVKPRILIVEDEPAICDNIQHVLESEGLDTLRCVSGQGVVSLLAEHSIDLIVLDIGLPDVSGFDLLREIRRTHATPVIFLTARTAELDRVLGLEIGADDYVQKPFSPRELSARVKAVLRRTRAPEKGEGAPAGAFVVHGSRRQVQFRGKPLELSRTEYELLTTFIRRPGHVFSRDALMSLVWSEPEAALDRSVDAHIKNIRAKLRAIDAAVDPIVTHRGSGYALREDL